MKLTTLVLCSTLGMALTSASVWGLTPPGADGSTTTKASVAGTDGAKSWTRPDRGDGGSDASPLAKWLGADEGAAFTTGETLRVAGRLGHTALDARRGGETFLMLELSADTDEVATSAAPVNLSIVLDRSRSMEGKRMANAVAAARGMVRRLRDGDTVSVVAYNSGTEVLVPATTIDERTRGDVLFSLRGVEARGHTCISCGIEAGIDAIGRRTGGVSHMLLLSDGEANFGVRDVEGFRRIADRARQADVSISTVGVDVDYNERVMFAVAQSSNGGHYFVENTASLPTIFDQELASLVSTVASEAEVELDLAPGVEVLEVLDRSFTRDGNRLIVPFGTFAAGEAKTLLVRLRVPGGEAGDRAVASVRTRFEDLTADSFDDRRGSSEGTLVATLTDDRTEISELDPVVEARVARSETAASLNRANELFSSGDVDAAKRELEDKRGRIRNRKSAAKTKSGGGKLGDKLDADFESQLRTLEDAEQGFSAAAAEAPAAAPTSRTGKAQVRSNAGQLDDLLK